MTNRSNSRSVFTALLAVVALVTMQFSALGQTKLKYHSNKYKPEDDVKLGRQAAQEAEQQYPLLRDETVRSYVARVGERLVAAIPPEFQHPQFQYNFKIVNASDINAFALPGGPMYVNRGMIEAARDEGEMAGVMAHELSHVALRHGTAQATKAQKYGLLAGIAGIAGTILGGPQVGQLAQAPFAVYFLKFSREYESEADILGAQMMARAGYDPRDLANMFRTIERQGGGGGGFLSDHPSPKDRYERINREAAMLRVTNPIDNAREFARIQERLRSYPGARSMAEITRSGQRYPTEGYPETAPRGRVEYPSSRYQSYRILGNDVQVSVPDNWKQLSESNSVWFAPEGGYGSMNGQAVFTHGVNIGMGQTNQRSLQAASEELLDGLTRNNRNLQINSSFRRASVAGRNGLFATLTNVNEATGQRENIQLLTTQSRDGQLVYAISVAPQNDRSFDSAFQTIFNSMRIND